jgi:hypothetical protein
MPGGSLWDLWCWCGLRMVEESPTVEERVGKAIDVFVCHVPKGGEEGRAVKIFT